MQARPTTDIADDHPEVAIPQPGYCSFGGVECFAGTAATVRCFEDNSRVRDRVAQPGEGRVLVVDGGASLRCALLGDRLARMAADNGWAGIIIHGCVRDSAELAEIDLGIQALTTHPRRSHKRGEGSVDEAVDIGGVTVRPGDFIAADLDGIVVLPGVDAAD